MMKDITPVIGLFEVKVVISMSICIEVEPGSDSHTFTISKNWASVSHIS